VFLVFRNVFRFSENKNLAVQLKMFVRALLVALWEEKFQKKKAISGLYLLLLGFA